jgi:DGQHR domain-containing protein
MSVLELPALAMTQSPGRTIFAFGVDGKQVIQFARVFQAKRDGDGQLLGYQRHQVRRHIKEIRSYVESERPMIPNAVVLAFDKRVEFVPIGNEGNIGARPGTLRIPLIQNDDDEPVGWIVDGQQRLTAIKESTVEAFHLFAVGFIAADEAEQREQFILVNNTRPLPKSLIYEMLPGVDAALPPALAARRLPSVLVDILNNTPGSPLYHVVKQYTNPSGRIKDKSLLKMLENSLSDGALYRFRMMESEDGKIEGITKLLFDFWGAVKIVWPDLWELKPRQSRLLHGAGIISLGFLMDAIADRNRDQGWPTKTMFALELEKMSPHCRWNEGFWEFGDGNRRKWSDIQNISKDVNLLANHLLRIYLRL